MNESGSVEFIREGAVFHGCVPRVMGTRMELLTCGASEDTVRPVWDALVRTVMRLDGVFNRFDPGSELSRHNAGRLAPEQRSPDFSEALELAENYRERTYGLFDVRVRARRDSSGPDLDFGGFAKGYFVRKAEEMLRAAGIGRAFLDFGGSAILGIGSHPYGNSWRVSLTDPYTGGTVSELDLCDAALSTSGNTPRYFGHIVHPRTGEPVVRPLMTTALCADPLDAEVLSTAAMLAGRRQLKALRDAFPGARIRIYEL